MRILVVCVLAVLVAVSAAPAGFDDVRLVRYTNEPYDNRYGRYSYGYALSDGSAHEQKGEIRNQYSDNEYLSVTGIYTWLAPNGVRYIVRYIADDNGYHPEVEEEPPGAPFEIVQSLLGNNG